jgi:outer membrane immunogenic protein
MRSKLILSAALAVGAMLSIGAASAADMPLKAAPVAVAPTFSWTGCYIGVHAGGGVLLDQGFQNGNNSVDDKHGIGGLAGGQIGCNYQTGMLVLGIEGEGFWSGMKVNSDSFAGNPQLLFQTTSISNKYDYDIAGRFGVAFDRALVYGKAGWVAAKFDWYSRQANFCGNCAVTTGTATLDGLLIGIGLEYAFAGNWTAKFEYDYLGFAAKNVNFVTVFPLSTGFNQIQNVSADKHIFKVGVNYLFNAGSPVVARY